MATGFPVKANYATGDVLTAANMNDLSGTLNYLNGVPYNKNAVINGGFDIWARGTSIAVTTSNTYTGDRWTTTATASAAMTVSRQSVSDSTNLPNIQYCARVQRNSGQTGTGGQYFYQNFETVNSIPFAGKTVTFSFYARAGANYSAASSGLKANVYTGTGTDQNVLTGTLTGQANPISQTATLTTTWQRFTYTATLATTATQIAVGFEYLGVGTAGANDYFEVTGVQLELGSVATPFSRAGGTIQGELAACQRYYWRTTATSAYGAMSPTAIAGTTTIAGATIQNPVPMRTTPTVCDFANICFFRYDQTVYALTSVSIDAGQSNPNTIRVAGTVSGATAGQVGSISANNNTAGYLGIGAEL